MKAFHGDFKLKEKLLKQLQAHYAADEIIQGIYWENGKGCAVGCAVHSQQFPHMQYETMFNIPISLARIQDEIFERLPNSEAKLFPIEFTEAVPVGADLSEVYYEWSIKALQRIKANAFDDGKKAIDQIIKLFKKPKDITDYVIAAASAAARAACDTATDAWCDAWAAADIDLKTASWSTAWAARSARAAARAAKYCSDEANNSASPASCIEYYSSASDAARAAVNSHPDNDNWYPWHTDKDNWYPWHTGASAAIAAEAINQKNDLLELLKKAGLLNITQASAVLNIPTATFRKKTCDSKYDRLKTNKITIAGKTFYNIEDLLKFKQQ